MMPARLPPILMRRDLCEPIDAPVWPKGVQIQRFATEHAAAVHALLDTAYRKGGGTVNAFAEWWSSLVTDAEFDPELLFMAKATDFGIVGIAHCWTSAFIKDLAVHPDWRRRGVGRALLLHAFGVFQRRGAPSVTLKVDPDNPSGAGRLYQANGMRPV